MKISRSKGPLYLQIKQVLKDRILHGIYPLHSLIPPEPQLEEEFQVSKITVRNAVKELVREGLLETRSGVGTRVIRNESSVQLYRGKRFTELLVEEGHQVQKQLLGMEILHNTPGSDMHQLFGERCYRISRLYQLDGRPFIHYMHYLNAELDIRAERLALESLYALIEEQGVELSSFRDEFSVALATEETADLLQVEAGSPLLMRYRYAYDPSDNLMEYSEGYIHTELHRYVTRVE